MSKLQHNTEWVNYSTIRNELTTAQYGMSKLLLSHSHQHIGILGNATTLIANLQTKFDINTDMKHFQSQKIWFEDDLVQ